MSELLHRDRLGGSLGPGARPRTADERLPLLWPGLRRSLGTAFAVVAALVLQVCLAAYYWVADPSASALLGPVWDVPAVMLLLAGWAAIGPRRRGWIDRLLVAVLTLLAFAYVVIGVGQGFALREFGYDVVLRLHISYVPELFRMMYDAEPLGWFIFYVALLALGVIALVAMLYGSISHLSRYARVSRRRQVGLAAGALVGTLVGGLAFGMQGPLTVEAYSQLDMALHLDKQLNSTARRMEIEASRLRNANPFVATGAERPTILLFVVESYGQVLFTSPDFAEFPAWLDREGAALAQSGYRVASKRMVAPVFGGSSWLAGTSLLCGVRVHTQSRYKAVMGSAVRCLPEYLNQAGYRTVLSGSNIKYHDPEYERTMRFDQYYIREDFAYRGPRLGWSFVPDQYTIDFVHRRELAPRLAAAAPPAEPLFIAYFLTNSHHPWAVVPPFVADWSKIGDGSVYAELPVSEFRNQFVGGIDYMPAYRTSVQYSLQSVLSYLGRLPPSDRSVIVVLGDHQPRRPVGRMKVDPWEVPVHVLSRDPSVVERFARVGFRPGFTPPSDQSEPGGFESFIEDIFGAYRDEAAKR